jgi:glycosyltransferase involved in cell wall biosynthesis
MRILYLNPIGALGGAERSLLDVLAIIREREPKWDLHLIAGADGALLTEAAALGVHIECLPMPEELLTVGDSGRSPLSQLKRLLQAGISARQYATKIRSRIEALAPDLIHSNGIKFHVLTRMLGPLNAPVIWHIRDFIGSRRTMRHALRWASSAATLAIANSESTATDARAVLPAVRVSTVLNAIDTVRFSPGVQRVELLDEFAGIPSAKTGTLRIGLLASYARWKGQELFLNAAELAQNAAVELSLRFYIVGGPIYKTAGSQYSADELKQIAARLGISDCVALIPFQNEPVEIYRALDVVVHASTQPEPFGRTIAEGMACGRAVIAANAGGATELFTDSHDALGVAPNDAPALSAAIVRLARDQALRETLGKNARTTAEQKFSLARMGQEILALYNDGLVTAKTKGAQR